LNTLPKERYGDSLSCTWIEHSTLRLRGGLAIAIPRKCSSPMPRCQVMLLLRSEIPSGMRAKFGTVAANNNRDHARNLSYCGLLALHIWWCYSSRTSRSWWITQSTQHHRRGCNNIASFFNEPHRSHVLCVKAELCTTFTSWSQHHFVAIGYPERHARKALCYSSRTSRSWWIIQSTQHHGRGCNIMMCSWGIAKEPTIGEKGLSYTWLFAVFSCKAFCIRFPEEGQYKPWNTGSVMFCNLRSNVTSFLLF